MFKHAPYVFSHMLLLLSRDVEQHSGPLTTAQSELLTEIHATLTQFKTGKADLAKQIGKLIENQKRTDQLVCDLSSRVSAIADRLPILQSNQNTVKKTESELQAAQTELALLKARCVGNESRSRRSSFVSFGIRDKAKETWSQSESVINLCGSS